MPDRNFDMDELLAMPRFLAVFMNMNADLALATSFSRNAFIEPKNWDGSDLGFHNVKPDWTQLDAYNGSIAIILTALVCQAVQGYFELKRLKPRLRDADIEQFLDGLEDRARFISGMKKFRHAVFHVKSQRTWRNRDLVFFKRVCSQRPGLAIVIQLLDLVCAFAVKCLSGELMIWPMGMDEEVERVSAQQAAVGGVTFEDFEDYLDGLAEP